MVAHKKLNLKEKIIDDYLDLSLSNLEKIPIKEISDISKLQHIKEIDLSKNHLQSLPDNIGSLVNLKSLDLLGNELKTLPASFSELKSLQWLDLKDNPLDLELKKYAGECSDEAQCKKCAVNVVRYMKQIAAEEERKRQTEIRRKKEEQSKKEAQELAKEKEIKLQKKREKEQKKLEQKLTKKENIEGSPINDEKNNFPSSSNGPGKRLKSGFHKILSLLSFLFFATLIFLIICFILINHCEDPKKLRNLIASYSYYEYFSSLIHNLDQKVCPIINQNKIPYENFIKLFQQINF